MQRKCVTILISYCRDVAKSVGTANAMVSVIWWLAGFYWVVGGGALSEAPRLFWLSLNTFSSGVFSCEPLSLNVCYVIATTYSEVSLAGFVLHFYCAIS